MQNITLHVAITSTIEVDDNGVITITPKGGTQPANFNKSDIAVMVAEAVRAERIASLATPVTSIHQPGKRLYGSNAIDCTQRAVPQTAEPTTSRPAPSKPRTVAVSTKTPAVEYKSLHDYAHSVRGVSVDYDSYTARGFTKLVGKQLGKVKGLALLTNLGVRPWVKDLPREEMRIAIMFLSKKQSTLYLAKYAHVPESDYHEVVRVLKGDVAAPSAANDITLEAVEVVQPFAKVGDYMSVTEYVATLPSAYVVDSTTYNTRNIHFSNRCAWGDDKFMLTVDGVLINPTGHEDYTTRIAVLRYVRDTNTLYVAFHRCRTKRAIAVLISALKGGEILSHILEKTLVSAGRSPK